MDDDFKRIEKELRKWDSSAQAREMDERMTKEEIEEVRRDNDRRRR